jgi:hypothetical protein
MKDNFEEDGSVKILLMMGDFFKTSLSIGTLLCPVAQKHEDLYLVI